MENNVNGDCDDDNNVYFVDECHCEGGLWVGFLAADIIAMNDYWILTFSII
jgi:hypothetical protein